MVPSALDPPPRHALSYADRARKAQAIRSPIEVVPATHTRPPQPTEPAQPNGDAHPPAPRPPPPPEPQQTPQPSPHKPAPVNVWDRRKEELAAKQASAQKPQPPTPARSTAPASSSSAENVSQAAPASESSPRPAASPAADDDDDDPFVVRSSRARPHVPVILSAESPEDWPEVGKSAPAPAQPPLADASRSEGDSTARKSGATKWVPLPLQPSEPQPQPRRDTQSIKGNRQSANNSRAPSNHGRNSRNHSGRNSANPSANHSRIHSNNGSVHSSPRNPRTRRLPGEESSTNRSSRTGSPSHVNPSSQGPSSTPSDLPTQPSSYGGYLSPPLQGPSPYYPPPPPQVNSPVYRSPSHGPHPGLPPESSSSVPMPPPQVIHYPYAYPNPYVSYDYTPYPYWNGHHSHPGSGTHSPAYPPSAAPSNYAAALPMHVQQHFYPLPPQPMQSSHSHSHSSSISGTRGLASSTAVSERGSAGKTSATSSPGVPTSNVAEHSVNGDIQRSASVVFGSIDSLEPTLTPSTSATDGESLEKTFKSIAIGVESAPKHRTSKPTKSVQKGENQQKVINVDPALEKEAGSTGEVKWMFGNDGLASPAGGVVAELDPNAENLGQTRSLQQTGMDEGLGDVFRVKNFGYGFGTPGGATMSVDVPKDEVDVPSSSSSSTKEKISGEAEEQRASQPQPQQIHSEFQPPSHGPSTHRPRGRGGYNSGGYGYGRGRGRGGMNGYGRGGYNRGYGGGRGGGGQHNNNNHNHSAYRGQGQGPPFTVTPPPHFQGLPPHTHHLGPPAPDFGAAYYGPPPHGHGPPRGPPPPLATYIPTGFEPYPPPPPPPTLASHSHSPSHHPHHLSASSTTSSSPSTTGHAPAPPPMPMPLSKLGFPLDSTRFYLLGQLEYYLSVDNMLQDWFLRQRMDSRGWIEIALLASFKRVVSLTTDYQLVRDVLMLSTHAEVRENHVRMVGWERFVLPDAKKSVVESSVNSVNGDSGNGEGSSAAAGYYPTQQQYEGPQVYTLGSASMDAVGSPSHMDVLGQNGIVNAAGGVPGVPYASTNGHGGEVEGEDEVEVDEVDDDDDDDDVVIVMGQNGGEGMWSHSEKRT